jgi:hypothetical protein
MQIPYLNEFLALLLPVIAVVLTFVHHGRAMRGRLPAFRPLRGIAPLMQRTEDMVETGQPIHVATGSNERGTIGASAETIAGLLVAQRIAEHTARQGGMMTVSSGDVAAHTAVRGTVHDAYKQSSFGGEYRGHEPLLVAHQAPSAYAMGVAQQLATEPPDALVMVGTYGSEALLIGGEAAQRRVPQLAGTTSFSALPALTLSTDATLVGEELFAAEAYLTDRAAPKARLLTHDALRWLVILIVVVGVAYQLANSLLALGLPSF